MSASNPATAESVARDEALAAIEAVLSLWRQSYLMSRADALALRKVIVFIRSCDAACAQRVREAYEKAAKIADARAPESPQNDYYSGQRAASVDIAERIRSLINTESTNSAALRKDDQ